MLIDQSLYHWSQTAPITIALEALEQEVMSAVPVRIYKVSGTAQVSFYEDAEKTSLVWEGVLPWEPAEPVAVDGLYVVSDTLTELKVVAETGVRKIDFTPYLNTTSGMTAVNSSYNDDSYYTVTGLSGFKFNNKSGSTIYVSSNHYIGFGSNTEHIKILRRDGCSTYIRKQSGTFDDGTSFVKIRFEGYTVYNNRVTSNRLIFELFILSNKDMFLNMITTPTSSNTGTSALVSSSTTELSLYDGNGGGPVVSFYHKDNYGYNWDVKYADYETAASFTPLYLTKKGDTIYTVVDNALVAIPETELTAAVFVEYGTTAPPASDLLLALGDHSVYSWTSDDTGKKLQADLVAYPRPSAIEAVADMSHPSILGMSLMTAEFSGNVTVSISLDDRASWSDEMPLPDWLNTDLEELFASLPESKRLYLRFVLHDDATISRFKITYINS